MADDYDIVEDELTVQLMEDGTFTVSRDQVSVGKTIEGMSPGDAAQEALEDLANMLAKASRG